MQHFVEDVASEANYETDRKRSQLLDRISRKLDAGFSEPAEASAGDQAPGCLARRWGLGPRILPAQCAQHAEGSLEFTHVRIG